MEALVLEWLNLAVRWFHLVAGIAWIGASFYFIWLDLSLRTPPAEKAARGIKGDVWAIHGGGIYEVSKYHTRPEQMPTTLHWFKWEAYSTWISGTALMVLFYYAQADIMLAKMGGPLSGSQSIVASVLFIGAGVLLYELLVRGPLVKRPALFACTLVVLFTAASYLAFALFAARAALVHLGAFMGSVMVGNVLLGIMPAQRKFLAAVDAGTPLPEAAMAMAKLRSTHNNYLTLPVLLCMIGNHSPFLYGHDQAWLCVAVLAALVAWGRHFFNLKHQGIVRPWILVTSAAGVVLLAIYMAHATAIARTVAPVAAMPATMASKEPASSAGEAASSGQHEVVDASKNVAGDYQTLAQLVATHCANCHARQPTQAGFAVAPGGIIIETPEQLQALKARALPAIESNYMPLGNFTELSGADRSVLIHWLSQQ
ncbi:urate hydroxylase PuuD [Simiduia sp. 21SJ11W-1]|uniref:urate hydroxylase PuuD n=1 Tax=Simiduia sp. 21SJ11W-1 TaxID=2909669 RepID=UPI00209EFE49|nr:urate hydroxylase PuuD [Simiduia sp. 21SJ11W-1]UTA48286.1 urate hydroxylase PuuD [Simiduia sp. 21SJ11W-1]